MDNTRQYEDRQDGVLERLLEGKKLTDSIQHNLQLFSQLFADVDQVQFRQIQCGKHWDIALHLIYIDGAVNNEKIDQHVIKPLMTASAPRKTEDLTGYLSHNVIQLSAVKESDDLAEIIRSLTYGDSLLLADGANKALLLDTKGIASRAIAEPDGEKILSGPREGFAEPIMQNLAMVRRKLRTCDLKMKWLRVGERSSTQICVAYLKSIVKQEVLDELWRRLGTIDIDAVLDANYITELIRDNRWSPFRTTGYSERPDVITAKLLEGRVAIFVDGTPVVITLPYLFIENFTSNEDYYLNFYYTSFARMLRITGFLLAIIVPALYVAITAYHHEMLPTPLMINVAIDSHNIPAPVALEAFLLMIMFDILRETGIRMPMGIGQALSIVGAVVVGSAAVEANFVSAPMIIITAVSGITSLVIPKMNAPVILLRLALLALASALGFFGLLLGLSLIFIHILKLKSFGVPLIFGDKPLRPQNIKDSMYRSPWWNMLERNNALSDNRVRQRPSGRRGV